MAPAASIERHAQLAAIAVDQHRGFVLLCAALAQNLDTTGALAGRCVLMLGLGRREQFQNGHIQLAGGLLIPGLVAHDDLDRKSTRLNSSH